MILTNRNTSRIAGTVSADDGKFMIVVPSGDYEIQIRYLLCNSLKIQKVHLGAGAMTELNVLLYPGTEETVVHGSDFLLQKK